MAKKSKTSKISKKPARKVKAPKALKASQTTKAAKMAKVSKPSKAAKKTKAPQIPKIKGTPWKTDKWFVSPWNYDPEVAKQFKFAPVKDIKIHDITLRDGEQQAGIAYSNRGCDSKRFQHLAVGLAELPFDFVDGFQHADNLVAGAQRHCQH